VKIYSEHPLSGGAKKTKLSQELQPDQSWTSPSGIWHHKSTVIAALSIVAIFLHLVLRFGSHTNPYSYNIPLLCTLVLGGLPLLYDLLRKLLKREFGSDLLGGISIITSILLGEYLPGSIIGSSQSSGQFYGVLGLANRRNFDKCRFSSGESA
jgi:cation transport ATPase